MDRVTRQVLEEVRGLGKLYLGDSFLREVMYYITMSQDFHRAGHMGGVDVVPGLKTIVGRFSNVDASRNFFDIVGKNLILQLEDGRSWHCFIKDIAGNAVNSGGLE